MIPEGAQYYIVKNNETDWTEWGINSGDRVYFKQTPGDFSIVLKSYPTPQEAMAAPPDPNLRAALGCLYRWDAALLQWITCEEPSIECMWWHAAKQPGNRDKIFKV